MTITLLVICSAVLVAGIASALMTASTLSEWLVRRRAESLPAELAERLLEEWLAELGHIESRVRQLVFSVRLFLTRRQTLIDATDTDDAIEDQSGAVVVSLDLRIYPDARDRLGAASIDFALLVLVPVMFAWFTEPALLTLSPVSLVWAVLWLVFVQILSVRLWQATPGERWAGIHVITVDGSPLGWGHILRRARAVFIANVLAACSFEIGLLSDSRGPLSEAALWCFILVMAWYRRTGSKHHEPLVRYFASGTTAVMNIPTVVGIPGHGPGQSNSLTR